MNSITIVGADFIRMRDFLYDGNIGVSLVKSIECAKHLLAHDIAWPIKLAKMVSRRKGYLMTVGLDCIDSEAVDSELRRQYPQVFIAVAESLVPLREDSAPKLIKCDSPPKLIRCGPSASVIRDAAPRASATSSSDTGAHKLTLEIVSKQLQEIMLKMQTARMDILTPEDCKSKTDLSYSNAYKAIAYYFKSTNEGWVLGKVHSKTHGRDQADFNYICIFDDDRRPYNLREDLYLGSGAFSTRRGALNAKDMSWVMFWKKKTKRRSLNYERFVGIRKKPRQLTAASNILSEDDDKDGLDESSDTTAVEEPMPIENREGACFYHGNAAHGSEILWEDS